MTPSELAAIEARCEAATPLPWEKLPLSMPREALLRIGEVTSFGTRQVQMREEDATFIAHARTDVPALLAEVRRLELAVSGYRRDVDNCLRELKARNTAIRDREVEISRLQAENERMRRGLEYISKRGPGSVDGECTDCESQCVDQARAAVNLLAGREWNESEGK